jgi:hypothetical protein
VRYLKSDLLVTRGLYDWLQKRLTAEDRDYNAGLIAPITPLLVRMSLRGVLADPDIIAAESDRLLQLMAAISQAHAGRFGQRLDVGDFHLRGWDYFRGLRCRIIRSGKKRLPSLRTEHLGELYHEADSAATRGSLALLHDYKLAQGLMTRLRALLRYVDPQTRRIYSGFDDFQASGRVSSTRPNLQQVARQVGPGQKKEFRSDPFRETVIRSRNALVAGPGCKLVAFDIAQADIRNLAHAVESFRRHGEEYLKDLERWRRRRLRKKIGKFRRRMWTTSGRRTARGSSARTAGPCSPWPRAIRAALSRARSAATRCRSPAATRSSTPRSPAGWPRTSSGAARASTRRPWSGCRGGSPGTLPNAST